MVTSVSEEPVFFIFRLEEGGWETYSFLKVEAVDSSKMFEAIYGAMASDPRRQQSSELLSNSRIR
jgi:hypothetical protein